VDLYGNTDTLSIRDPDERIATSVFNELYLQARYEELSPTIDYLKSQGIVDPLRPESEQIQFFRTNVGINSQINEEIREAYKIGDDLKNLKAYIDTNLDKIIRLDTNIRIVGEREEIDEADAAKIEEELKTLLPRSNYYAEIGVRDISTGESKDLFKMIRVP
jgi:hypothetical protein